VTVASANNRDGVHSNLSSSPFKR